MKTKNLIIIIAIIIAIIGIAVFFVQKQNITTPQNSNLPTLSGNIVETNDTRLEMECNNDLDCETYLSTNTCKVICATKNDTNRKIINSYKRTCNSSLWDRYSIDCKCIKNSCKVPSLKNNTKTDEIKLEGTITNVSDACFYDGVCQVEIDNKWWIPIIIGGLKPPSSKPEIRGEVVGVSFNEESIGKKVKIYAKKINENKLTIFGNKKYYVKVIDESNKIIIEHKDKNCNLDTDCVLFQADCGDCEIDTLNKKNLQKYIDKKNEYCSINKPKKQCDIIFTGSLKCVDNVCVK